ncbi:type II toxin-antitoxin system HicA family toxin [Serratia fonticola]
MKSKVEALQKKQREIPPPSGIKWKSIESLIVALGGEVKQGNGSRVRFLLQGSLARFHRPHPSPDTDKGAVVSLREWLESLGVGL